jgi:DNA-binding transcriptional LysR family regulator
MDVHLRDLRYFVAVAEATALVAYTAAEAKVLRVGTLTSLGRELLPTALENLAERQPGWRVRAAVLRLG